MNEQIPDIETLKQKACRGDLEAQMTLAEIYLSEESFGGIVYYDSCEAEKWLALAAEQDDAKALATLSIFKKNTYDAISLLKRSAEKGYTDAYTSLGFIYMHRKNFKKALYWFEKSYEIVNDDMIARRIGEIYFTRMSSSSDYSQGVKWFEKSIKLGSAYAAFLLAEYHENGFKVNANYSDIMINVSPNMKSAVKWYLQSAEMGYQGAQYKYAVWCYEGNEIVTRNYRKAFQWMLKAACQNEYWSIPRVELSMYFRNGIGIASNLIEAYVWALLSRDFYNADDLKDLENLLTKEELDAAQDEAETRFNLLKDNHNDDNKLYNYITNIFADDVTNVEPDSRSKIFQNQSHTDDNLKNTYNIEQSTTDIQASQANKSSDHREFLKTWKVTDIGMVKIDINPKEKNIRISYGKKKARFGLTELFSKSALRLLIDYDKHATDPHEPPIAYYGTSINTPLNLTRNNQDVVSDFNGAFRRLFGLAKDVKAFTWLPGTKARRGDKTLTIHFQLKVHYRV